MKNFIFLLFFVSNLSYATFMTAKSAHSLANASENKQLKEEKQKFFTSVEEQIETDIENGNYFSNFCYDLTISKYKNELINKLNKLGYAVTSKNDTCFQVSW